MTEFLQEHTSEHELSRLSGACSEELLGSVDAFGGRVGPDEGFLTRFTLRS